VLPETFMYWHRLNLKTLLKHIGSSHNI
jgi:hypothetical protein